MKQTENKDILKERYLPESSMVFELKDGNKITICKADMDKIIMHVVTEAIVSASEFVQKIVSNRIGDEDKNRRADTLFKIIKEQPDMADEIKNQYLTAIWELLKQNKTS